MDKRYTEDDRYLDDSIRHALLHDLGPEDSEAFERELRACPDFRPSPRPLKFNRKIKKALRQSERRRHRAVRRLALPRRSLQIVISILLIFGVSISVVAGIPELRDQIIRIYEDHVDFGTVEEPDWSGLYKPSYMTKGYVCDGHDDFVRKSDSTRATFRNSLGDELTYYQYIPETQMSTDSEGAEICELVDVLGEKDGLFVRKDGVNKLFWGSYYGFQLRGSLDLKELLKIARSVDFIPEKTG